MPIAVCAVVLHNTVWTRKQGQILLNPLIFFAHLHHTHTDSWAYLLLRLTSHSQTQLLHYPWAWLHLVNKNMSAYRPPQRGKRQDSMESGANPTLLRFFFLKAAHSARRLKYSNEFDCIQLERAHVGVCLQVIKVQVSSTVMSIFLYMFSSLFSAIFHPDCSRFRIFSCTRATGVC